MYLESLLAKSFITQPKSSLHSGFLHVPALKSPCAFISDCLTLNSSFRHPHMPEAVDDSKGLFGFFFPNKSNSSHCTVSASWLVVLFALCNKLYANCKFTQNVVQTQNCQNVLKYLVSMFLLKYSNKAEILL